MSRSFADPAKAEEILTNLVDPNTGFHQACTFRVGTKLPISNVYFRAGLFRSKGCEEWVALH